MSQWRVDGAIENTGADVAILIDAASAADASIAARSKGVLVAAVSPIASPSGADMPMPPAVPPPFIGSHTVLEAIAVRLFFTLGVFLVLASLCALFNTSTPMGMIQCVMVAGFGLGLSILASAISINAHARKTAYMTLLIHRSRHA